MDEVRWGFIGLGNRGMTHLRTVLQLEKARVTALSEPHVASLERALKYVSEKEKQPPFTCGADDWMRVLETPNVDAVIISSPWELHASMATAAMRAGKHAYVELPAANSIEECWQLVDTSEATGRHCMLLENCNYGREELMLLNMVRQGLLGEILHGEGAYIHDLREQMYQDEHGCGSWRTYHYANRQGNLYPSHGLGPIAHCMDVNRGDYFDSLVSMSSLARGRALFAKENFPSEHKWNQVKHWNCGDINTSLIKLVSGRTIMLQWDETSPRPYSRLNFLQGTKGAFGGFPNRIALDCDLMELPDCVRSRIPQKNGRTNFHDWDTDMKPWYQAYDHPLWKRVGAYGEEHSAHGGHGGVDYVMLWRIQQCLLEGLPMDQSVYDAALWSAVTPLSRASVEQGGAPQKFPDFTRGKWRRTPIITVE
jgi:hypothetical protein